MTCEQARIQMLGGGEGKDFAEHLASCESCRNEVARIGTLWQSLDLLPMEEPSGQVRERFYEMLGAYRQGMASAEPRRAFHWWQMAAAAALVAVGLGIGYMVRGNVQAPAEVSQLREEVANMRQLVALSLMQQQSASDRLRGVSWAYRAEPSDREVLGALVTAVNYDTNVNVRLAAVDALRRFAASPETRRAVVEALPSQKTPLVQVALIDLLVDFKERSAEGTLRTLAENRDTSVEVRQQARWALEKLQ
ncbi:MAG: HEAT repeat domain-containing protein [Terriglobales bacterium]